MLRLAWSTFRIYGSKSPFPEDERGQRRERARTPRVFVESRFERENEAQTVKSYPRKRAKRNENISILQSAGLGKGNGDAAKGGKRKEETRNEKRESSNEGRKEIAIERERDDR